MNEKILGALTLVLLLSACIEGDSDESAKLTEIMELAVSNDSHQDAILVDANTRVIGNVSDSSDFSDFFKVEVREGQVWKIYLFGPLGTDFDIGLYSDSYGYLGSSLGDRSEKTQSVTIGEGIAEVVVEVSASEGFGEYELVIINASGEHPSSGAKYHAVVDGDACIEVSELYYVSRQNAPYLFGSCSTTDLNFAGSCQKGTEATFFYIDGNEEFCDS